MDSIAEYDLKGLKRQIKALEVELDKSNTKPIRKHDIRVEIGRLSSNIGKIHESVARRQARRNRNYASTMSGRHQTLKNEQAMLSALEKERIRREHNTYQRESEKIGNIDDAIYHQLLENTMDRQMGISTWSNKNIKNRASKSVRNIQEGRPSVRGIRLSNVPDFKPEWGAEAEKRRLFNRFDITPMVPFEHKTNVNSHNAATNSQGGHKRKTRRNRKQRKTLRQK